MVAPRASLQGTTFWQFGQFGQVSRYQWNQGCVIQRIHLILRIVSNAYFTVLNKSGHIIRLQNLHFCRFLAFVGNFRPNNGLQESFHCCCTMYYYIRKELGTFWVILGRTGSFWVKNRHSQHCFNIRSYNTRILITRIYRIERPK